MTESDDPPIDSLRDQVNAIADKLLSKGVRPTFRLVSSEIEGSHTKIMWFLEDWALRHQSGHLENEVSDSSPRVTKSDRSGTKDLRGPARSASAEDAHAARVRALGARASKRADIEREIARFRSNLSNLTSSPSELGNSAIRETLISNYEKRLSTLESRLKLFDLEDQGDH